MGACSLTAACHAESKAVADLGHGYPSLLGKMCAVATKGKWINIFHVVFDSPTPLCMVNAQYITTNILFYFRGGTWYGSVIMLFLISQQ